MKTHSELLDQLAVKGSLSKGDWTWLISHNVGVEARDVFRRAQETRHLVYGHDVYIRGLIELSNYCKNDCYYCGLRKSNHNASRYRLSTKEVLSCCAEGYRLGFRTFVLQGGEDPWYTDDRLVELVGEIRKSYPDCAITLSLGERNHRSYQALYDAGANRYLLRHETANEAHYRKLHPDCMSHAQRKQCLLDLKEIGYQVGCGFMVGSPFQTLESLAEDMLFLTELQPHMVGIGPFIPHHDTPFRDAQAGSVALTLYLLALIRLALPHVLLPATTALGTADAEGREKGIQSGANVVMPNLSPAAVRGKYLIYDNKLCTGDEAAESILHLKKRMEAIGYHVVTSRGDCIK